MYSWKFCFYKNNTDKVSQSLKSNKTSYTDLSQKKLPLQCILKFMLT